MAQFPCIGLSWPVTNPPFGGLRHLLSDFYGVVFSTLSKDGEIVPLESSKHLQIISIFQR